MAESTPARSKVDELLPPGAEIDELLPPGDASAPLDETAASPTPVAKSSGETESLLPEGAEESGRAPMQQIALPEKEMAEAERPKLPLRAPDGSVVIPTDDGSYTTLREPVKTVGEGINERELVTLPPEVKARRRMVRGIIVYMFCIVVLIVVLGLLAK